jgi:hypothetical protein
VELSAAQADRLREFAERTRTNLMFIERHVRDNPASPEVYEVTQLLNSLLWLVVAADEWLVIDDTVSLETLRHEGFPRLRLTGKKPPTDLKTLTSFLRNAVSHVNLDFVGEMGQITEVRLWNHQHGKLTEPHTADLVVSVAELRRLAELLPMRYGLLEPTMGTLKLRPERL